MVAKVAGVVLGIGLLGTGSIALAKPGLLGMMPHYTKLSDDHDYKSREGTDYSNKFGGKNKDKLVGVTGDKQGKDGNKEWWEWSFKKLQAEEINSGAFAVKGGSKKVDSAYSKESQASGTNLKALNRVCEAAYKSDPSKIKTTPSSTATDEFDEKHVWEYCSWLGKKPETTNN